LKLYEEGFLSVCADRRRGHGDEQLLDLRYLDPRPRISRVVAVRLLYPAIYSAALAVAATAFASFGVLPAVTWPLASAFGAAAATLAWLFGSRTGEHATFRTARGQTEALDLFGPLGSVDMLRRIVPALVVAIREAAEAAEPTDAHTYLREEMREHYRLAQAGVISPAECATGTYRILAQFARAHDGPRA
jgi:hypothetical protein